MCLIANGVIISLLLSITVDLFHHDKLASENEKHVALDIYIFKKMSLQRQFKCSIFPLFHCSNVRLQCNGYTEFGPHCLVHALIYETSYIFVMANFWNLPLLMVHAPSTPNNGACTCFRDAPECGVIG